MSDYKIDVTVKNNRIYKRIKLLGFESIQQFTTHYKLSYVSLIKILNFKLSPLNSKGNFREVVLQIAHIFNCLPDELFSSSQIHAAIESNRRSYEIEEAEVKHFLEIFEDTKLLEDQYLDGQVKERLYQELSTKLTPREEKVIKLRYGLEDYDSHTLEEVGKQFDLSREVIRRIEAKAMRKLRHPSGLHQYK